MSKPVQEYQPFKHFEDGDRVEYEGKVYELETEPYVDTVMNNEPGSEGSFWKEVEVEVEPKPPVGNKPAKKEEKVEDEDPDDEDSDQDEEDDNGDEAE